ncbi:sensor histidine kinase [Streptomyces sp. NPDC057638]|uniref:sensor histidine kinase n=1 Tax=Streptomyces sp. NPDC057638 TaxID=3346190 RepID=UPI0036A43AD6
MRGLFLFELLSAVAVLWMFWYGKAKLRIHEESVTREKFRERRRIARELHDGAGHRMLAIVMHARRLGAENSEAAAAAETIEELAVQAGRDVRGALGCLPRQDRPGQVDGPLTDRVVALGVDLPEVGLRARFTNVGAEVNVHARVRHEALRLIQEGVTNAIKHGDGPIDVGVTFGDRLEVTITNGPRAERGAPTFQKAGRLGRSLPGGGQGIPNMRRRAYELGGDLDFRRLPGGGVRIAAVLPLNGRLEDPLRAA